MKTKRAKLDPLAAQASARRLNYLENEILAQSRELGAGTDLAGELEEAAQLLEQVQESLNLMAQQ